MTAAATEIHWRYQNEEMLNLFRQNKNLRHAYVYFNEFISKQILTQIPNNSGLGFLQYVSNITHIHVHTTQPYCI